MKPKQPTESNTFILDFTMNYLSQSVQIHLLFVKSRIHIYQPLRSGRIWHKANL